MPKSGPSEFRNDPSKCIPCHAVVEVNDLIMFWFDAESKTGVGKPTWELDLPDVSKFPRRAFARSITPTHMAPLHENIVDDQHFIDVKTFMNMVYPWAMLGQTYYLHTQDRRVYFEKGEYDFFNDVPKGFEKVNMFRRWVHEELMGGTRPMGPNSIPTKFVPVERLAASAKKSAPLA